MSSPSVFIVADDLTGALDTATPFVAAGRSVACAVRPEALAAALGTGADVVVVNSVSRHLPADEAACIVRDIAHALRPHQPRLVFKKIDSRLKGNVGAETAALAEALGFTSVLVAPAVPDQGRKTRGGMVTGHGVPAPLPIAPCFAGHGLALDVADTETAEDFDLRVAATDWSRTLAVGARGLGQALAGPPLPSAIGSFLRSSATLFAIGSHDPITLAQVTRLDNAEHIAAPMGALATPPTRLPAIIQSTGTFAGADSAISDRFATGIVAAIDRLAPECVLLSGGDTALAVLDRLGTALIRPLGEAAPGLPWFELDREGRSPLRAIVKSGGFGAMETLAALVPGA